MKSIILALIAIFGICVRASPQYTFNVNELEESDKDHVLIGTVSLDHRYLLRNDSIALPANPTERAKHLNETHYFGPAVTEPVEYQNGLFGNYIILRQSQQGGPIVVIQDRIARLQLDGSADVLVVTPENGGHCTGRESNGAAALGIGIDWRLAMAFAATFVTAY